MRFLRVSLCLLGLCSTVTAAHDGVVNISGTFRNNTCVLAQDSQNMTVPLGDVALTHFSSQHYGPETAFTLHLQACGKDVTNVSITFSGTADGRDEQLLALDAGAEAATGLAIALLDDHRELIALKQASRAYALTPGDVALNFYAQLRPTATDVTAGDVSASATFVLHYD